jgi:hypothetical protein
MGRAVPESASPALTMTQEEYPGENIRIISDFPVTRSQGGASSPKARDAAVGAWLKKSIRMTTIHNKSALVGAGKFDRVRVCYCCTDYLPQFARGDCNPQVRDLSS